jgi:hypothetical protein
MKELLAMVIGGSHRFTAQHKVPPLRRRWRSGPGRDDKPFSLERALNPPEKSKPSAAKAGPGVSAFWAD